MKHIEAKKNEEEKKLQCFPSKIKTCLNLYIDKKQIGIAAVQSLVFIAIFFFITRSTK